MEQRLFLILFLGVLCWQLSTAMPYDYVNTTEHFEDQDHSLINKTAFIPAPVRYHCLLVPQNTTLTEAFKKSVDDGATMIELKVKFRGDDWLPATVRGRETSKMFKPFFWVRTTGRYATRLLLLKPNYDIMSFKSLEIKVDKFKRIALKEYPENCMDRLTYDNVEEILRELVLNNFRNTTKQVEEVDPDEKVCNLHIREGRWADFRYYCCQRGKDMRLTCNYLHEDFWLELMNWVIGIIKTVFILFCPLLVPSVFYQTITDDSCFRYELDKPKRITVQLRDGQDPYREPGTTCIYTRLRKIRKMDKFRTLVDSLQINDPIPSHFDVKVAELQTEGERLVNPGEAPSRIIQTLYEFVCNCRVRELKSVNACCDANVKCPCNCSCTWHRLVQNIMKFVLGLFWVIPWAIRVMVYYKYEHKEITMRKEAAYERGYTFLFPGNLTWYMTPLHWIFIFIYVLLFMEAIVFNNVSKRTKEKFQVLFRKCYQDMLTDSRTKAFGLCVQILLIPFRKLGFWVIFFGIFMWLFLLPVAIVYSIFHMFPTVNLTLRMLIHFMVYAVLGLKREPVIQHSEGSITVGLKNIEGEARRFLNNVTGRILQASVIFFCLITTFSVIALLFEMITFFLDVFIYTLIGTILHAEYTMTFLSLAILLLVYAKDCFGSVPKRYRKYSATLNKYIMSLCEKEALPVIYQKSKEQENRAFAVNPCIAEEDPCKAAKRPWPNHNDVDLNNSDNHLTWTVRKVAFFLTKNDEAKIPTKLLFDACIMNYEKKPGRLLHQYIEAFQSFMWIVLFLLFVLLVIITFGKTAKLSATNQLLGTVAGGMLPFLLRKFVFKSHEDQPVEPEKDINFRVAIHDLINEYHQNWPVHDIETMTYIQRPRMNGNTPSSDTTTTTEQPRMKGKGPPVETTTATERPRMKGNGPIAETTTTNEQPRMKENTLSSDTDNNATEIVIEVHKSEVNKFEFPKLYNVLKNQRQTALSDEGLGDETDLPHD